MLEPRQIREIAIDGLRGKKKEQLDRYLAEIADSVEELIAENNRIKADNVGLDDADAFRKARIAELEAKNAELMMEITRTEAVLRSCEQIKKEHDELLAVLQEQKNAPPQPAAPSEPAPQTPAREQADEILAKARQQAEALVEQGRKEYTAALRRAEVAISRKSEDFQTRLRSDVSRWRSVDADLRELKTTMARLAAAMPDGVDACFNKPARQLWESLGADENK